MTPRHRIGLILTFLAICGTALIAQRVLEAARRPDRPAVLYEVIREQIVAVQQADFPRAYQQVSTGFQEKFNVNAFADLARSDYPEIGHASRVEFGRVAFDGRRAVVEVYFFLPNGDVLPCYYTLINEENAWKIDAARLQKRWPTGRRLGGTRI